MCSLIPSHISRLLEAGAHLVTLRQTELGFPFSVLDSVAPRLLVRMPGLCGLYYYYIHVTGEETRVL